MTLTDQIVAAIDRKREVALIIRKRPGVAPSCLELARQVLRAAEIDRYEVERLPEGFLTHLAARYGVKP